MPMEVCGAVVEAETDVPTALAVTCATTATEYVTTTDTPVRDVRDRHRPGSGDYYNGTGRPCDPASRLRRVQRRSHGPRRTKTPDFADEEEPV